jgi:hypothetical protein
MSLENSQIISLLAAVMVAAALYCAGTAARAEADPVAAVALVIELSGKAETQAGGRPVAVSLLSEFGPGARVRLHKDAKLIVLFYRTAEQYAISGPSLLRFTDTGLEALSGNEPIRKPALIGKDGRALAVRAIGVVQAGAVVRGRNKPIPALAPAGGVTLEVRPTFRWSEVEPGLDYRFTLKDEGDAVLLARTLRGTVMQLPPDLALAEGQRYRWSVFAQAADGTAYGSNYRFTVADAATRADVENFRPDQGASLGERVAYSVWLEQSGLLDEARRYWQRLGAEGLNVPTEKLEALR